jgi:hypothetical protein
LKTVDISTRDLPEPLPYWALINTPGARAKAIDRFILTGDSDAKINNPAETIKKIRMSLA